MRASKTCRERLVLFLQLAMSVMRAEDIHVGFLIHVGLAVLSGDVTGASHVCSQ